MRIKIHRGLGQIGGNVVEVSTASTAILLDLGAELSSETAEPHPLDVSELLAAQRYDAVFVSHYHGDHIGLLQEEAQFPPVYMGAWAYRLYSESMEYQAKPVPFVPGGFLEDRVPLAIGDLTITPYSVDHSAADSYSFLVSDGEAAVFYTGDFRGNGWADFDRYIDGLPEHVDALITEGTTLSRPGHKNISEAELQESFERVIEDCDNQVFVLMSPLNIDRIVTVYQATRACGRAFLQDPYMALLALTDEEGRIPNPVTCDDVYVYIPSSVREDAHARYQELFSSKFIGRRTVEHRIGPYVMAVRSSWPMLRNLEKLNDGDRGKLCGSVLIYSLWEGYKMQPNMRKFLDRLSAMGIESVSLHASGHADESELKKLIAKIDPTFVIPIHTECEEWFRANCPESCVYTEETLVIGKGE